jgi:hypothetical protein
MQRAWRARILRPGKGVVHIVGVFTPDVAKRDGGETRCQFGGEMSRGHSGTLVFPRPINVSIKRGRM